MAQQGKCARKKKNFFKAQQGKREKNILKAQQGKCEKKNFLLCPEIFFFFALILSV